MSVTAISVDLKNPAEVLGCFGILVLDFFHDHQIQRSRFTESLMLTSGKDGRFRTGTFEVEHPDFAVFLNQCRNMQFSDKGAAILIECDGKPVVAVDWFWVLNVLFVGDIGNFSKADKLSFVKTHHKVLTTVLDVLTDCKELFTTPVDLNVPNFLSGYNSRKQPYQDAGGMYEAEDTFYASEWFLLSAVQAFRHSLEKSLRQFRSLRYSFHTDWLPTNAAFAAFAGGFHACRSFEAERRKFGKGTTLRVAKEV